MPEIKIIKKYANRTMYDTSQSKYISLNDLKQFVIDEIPFEVQEAKSKKDITRQVLLHIIADEENAGTPLFTTDVLTRFIRMYGDSMQGAYSGYLEQLSDFMEQQTTQFFDQFSHLPQQSDNNPMTAWTDMAKRNMESWQEAQKNMWRMAGAGSKKDDKES